MSEIRECLFYIDYNPPEGCGTCGGAIHKGKQVISECEVENATL